MSLLAKKRLLLWLFGGIFYFSCASAQPSAAVFNKAPRSSTAKWPLYESLHKAELKEELVAKMDDKRTTIPLTAGVWGFRTAKGDTMRWGDKREFYRLARRDTLCIYTKGSEVILPNSAKGVDVYDSRKTYYSFGLDGPIRELRFVNLEEDLARNEPLLNRLRTFKSDQGQKLTQQNRKTGRYLVAEALFP